ncbi:uncharacterized protein IL334_002492 [Kwoniella shivajii]|uniref:BTB domain-containing protein n=1 Tax=Kwoniella shivajii TaxID=564305 RepID=A0ABZ1CZ22_9TREE|nr:hypothetical protein IL334_002492 [Kwoniella shivajii]
MFPSTVNPAGNLAPSNGSATPSTPAYSSATGVETTANGLESSGGVGESSKNAVRVDPTYHAINLSNWAFNVGYLHQDWTDINLTFFQSGLKAHRLILARSPYLAHLLRNVIPGTTIHLNFADENITQDSVHIALQHLYNPSQNLIDATNARSILATAYLFGGIPELIHQSYTIIRSSINHENVVDHIHWLSQSPDLLSNGFRNGNSNGNVNGNGNGNGNGSGNSTMYGSVQVSEGQATILGLNDNWENNKPRYGEWTNRLKNDVIDYIIHQLPSEFPNLTSDPTIISIFSKLPYELFKSIIESPEIPITSMQDRFAFTKKIIAQRKKIASSSGSGNVGGMEESVVLAFKGGEGMEIHISRKPKKSRQLFKVEG